MPQLPGQKCVRCGETIAGTLDAQFCRECGCPVHNRCMVGSSTEGGVCEHCGTPDHVATAFQEQERLEWGTRTTESQRDQANSNVTWGGVLLTGGIVFTVASHWIAVQSGVSGYLVATGLIGAGLIRLLQGIDQRRSLRTESRTERPTSDAR